MVRIFNVHIGTFHVNKPLRRFWRVLTCSSLPEAPWEEFQGAMVQEGSCRTKVRMDMTHTPPLCAPLKIPSELCDWKSRDRAPSPANLQATPPRIGESIPVSDSPVHACAHTISFIFNLPSTTGRQQQQQDGSSLWRILVPPPCEEASASSRAQTRLRASCGIRGVRVPRSSSSEWITPLQVAFGHLPRSSSTRGLAQHQGDPGHLGAHPTVRTINGAQCILG